MRRLEACNGRERRAWEGRPRFGRARATQCGRGRRVVARRLKACNGRERRAWEGQPRVGRARATTQRGRGGFDRSLRRLEACNGREGRAWEGQPRFGRARAARCGREGKIVATLGSVQRKGGKSVGARGRPRVGRARATYAVRPRKKDSCEAWKRATEGGEERGRDSHASAEHVQSSSAAEEELLRRLEACNGGKRRAWEGRSRVGRARSTQCGRERRIVATLGSAQRKGEKGVGGDTHASAEHEQGGAAEKGKSLRSLEACNGRKRRAWEGRPRVSRARATQCGRGRRIVATLGSVQRKEEQSVVGNRQPRFGTARAARCGRGRRIVATLGSVKRKERRAW